MSSETKPKVVLAYSGGLDTSVILKWLCEKGFEVVAFCADVGQHHEDFEAVKAKAVSCGAVKCVVADLRKEFVEHYIFEALKCNAIYEGRYLLGTSVARPCISKEMIRIAKAEGARYISHGATGKGNDQVRFEMCAQALDAQIGCIAPWRDAEFIESFKGRKDLLAYCTKHGIPVDAKPKSNYSIDENLFHTSYESGCLEEADVTYEEDMFKMTVSPQSAPDASTDIEIEFVKGIPVKLTNKTDGTVKVRGRHVFTGKIEPSLQFFFLIQYNRASITDELDGPARALHVRERDRRRQRRRPHRHRREPVRGHQIPGRLRDARRHPPPRGAHGPRGHMHGPGGQAHLRAHGGRVRAPLLQRVLVRARDGPGQELGHVQPEGRHGRRQAGAVQGERHLPGEVESERSLQPRPGQYGHRGRRG